MLILNGSSRWFQLLDTSFPSAGPAYGTGSQVHKKDRTHDYTGDWVERLWVAPRNKEPKNSKLLNQNIESYFNTVKPIPYNNWVFNILNQQFTILKGYLICFTK